LGSLHNLSKISAASPPQRDLENNPKAWASHLEEVGRLHRRSLVETKMGCFKRLGERVMARDFDRQVTQLQVRASILNRFTSLDPARTVRVG
jgi:hypothetical protein